MCFRNGTENLLQYMRANPVERVYETSNSLGVLAAKSPTESLCRVEFLECGTRLDRTNRLDVYAKKPSHGRFVFVREPATI